MTKRSQVNTRIVLIAMVAFGILAIFNDYFKIILLILTVGIILLSIISKPSVGRSNSGSISDTRTSNSNQNLNPLFDTKFTNSITNDGDSPMDTFSLDDIPNGRASLISAEYEDWVIPLDLLKSEQQKIAKELAVIEHEIKAHDTTFEQIAQNLNMALDIIENCGKAYRDASDTIKKLMNQAIFEKFYIVNSPDLEFDIEFTFKPPFDQILEPIKETYTDLLYLQQ